MGKNDFRIRASGRQGSDRHRRGPGDRRRICRCACARRRPGLRRPTSRTPPAPASGFPRPGGEAIGIQADVTDARADASSWPPRRKGPSAPWTSSSTTPPSLPGSGASAFEEIILGGMGQGARGQRSRRLRMLQGGGAAHAAPGPRKDRERRLGHRVQGLADAAALRGIQGSGGRADAGAGAGARAATTSA